MEGVNRWAVIGRIKTGGLLLADVKTSFDVGGGGGDTVQMA